MGHTSLGFAFRIMMSKCQFYPVSHIIISKSIFEVYHEQKRHEFCEYSHELFCELYGLLDSAYKFNRALSQLLGLCCGIVIHGDNDIFFSVITLCL
jgi:hypothetical protein